MTDQRAAEGVGPYGADGRYTRRERSPDRSADTRPCQTNGRGKPRPYGADGGSPSVSLRTVGPSIARPPPRPPTTGRRYGVAISVPVLRSKNTDRHTKPLRHRRKRRRHLPFQGRQSAPVRDDRPSACALRGANFNLPLSPIFNPSRSANFNPSRCARHHNYSLFIFHYSFFIHTTRDGLRQLATGEKPSQLSQLSQIKENSV